MSEQKTIMISSEMVSAGLAVFELQQDSLPNFLLVEEVYRSMERVRRLESSRAKVGTAPSLDHDAY